MSSFEPALLVPLCRARGRLLGLPSPSTFVRAHILDIAFLTMTSYSTTYLQSAAAGRASFTGIHFASVKLLQSIWYSGIDRIVRERLCNRAVSRSVLSLRKRRLEKLQLFESWDQFRVCDEPQTSNEQHRLQFHSISSVRSLTGGRTVCTQTSKPCKDLVLVNLHTRRLPMSSSSRFWDLKLEESQTNLSTRYQSRGCISTDLRRPNHVVCR
jgi:hypothetical protein